MALRSPSIDLPPFVTSTWLSDNYDDVVICDVRNVSDPAKAVAAFEESHLPGAHFVDLNSDLAAPPGDEVGRHPLHDPVIFAALMGILGIGIDTPVVAYDSAGGAFAARMVWMLRATGTPAAVLIGGSAHWSGQFEAGAVEIEAVDRPAVEWPEDLLASVDDVAVCIGKGGIVIDSRAADRYRGEVEPLDAVAGHIPGARNLPFADHLESGLLKSEREIRERFAQVQVDGSGEPPIIYCGSGVTACVNILAAEAVGLGNARLYVGSWSGWSTTEQKKDQIAVGDM